ncbi:MAG: DUF4835 family protein, partial [Chitinophagaceae bacterium]
QRIIKITWMKRCWAPALLFAGWFMNPCISKAQELNARVTVVANKIRGVDLSVFQSLQKAIQDLLNNQQWTDVNYAPDERINCNLLVDIQSQISQNTYSAILTIQSSRPVYNSSYITNLFNFKDKNVAFKFDPFEPLNFNENNISGNDPMSSNLTAILAYYAYIIIGLDRDSFSPNGGNTLFKKAQNVVSNAPANSSNISGWKAYEGTQNRYWLVENLLNTRYKDFHKVLYDYHRMGLDRMYDHLAEGRDVIMNCLNLLNSIYADNPNTVLLQMFFEAKWNELAGIFSDAPPQQQVAALNLLQKLDPEHGTQYREALK